MFNYIVKKVAYGLLVMLGVITLIFVLFNLLPGDPARMMLGQNADRESIEILFKKTVKFSYYILSYRFSF